jgi:hypothetical protein
MAAFDMFSRLTKTAPLPPAMLDLVDEWLVCEVEWTTSTAAVADAYRSWSRAATDDRHLSYASYVASLDQEEAAATALADVALRLGSAAA